MCEWRSLLKKKNSIQVHKTYFDLRQNLGKDYFHGYNKKRKMQKEKKKKKNYEIHKECQEVFASVPIAE